MFAAAAVFAVAFAYKSAHGENCLTNNNIGTTTTVTGTAGSFFQLGGSDVVRFPNPPGIGNAQSVTTNGSSNTPGNSLTGLSCGTGSKAAGANSVAIGRNAQANADNSVALGANSTANRANTVSVGTLANPRTISNVATGTAPTDAANTGQVTAASNQAASQLQTVTSQFTNTTNNLQNQITSQQSQITGVRNEVTTLRKQTNAGISMAMAAAALQTGAGSAGSGKVAIGMAGGEFAGTASLSAGIAYSPTKRLNFNAGVSVAPIVGMFGVFGGTTYTLN